MGQSWKTSHLFLGWLPEPISRFRPNTESADFCRQQERVARTIEILHRLIDRHFGVTKDLNSFGASIKQQLETFAEGFILRLIVSASVLETDGKLIPCPPRGNNKNADAATRVTCGTIKEQGPHRQADVGGRQSCLFCNKIGERLPFNNLCRPVSDVKLR